MYDVTPTLATAEYPHHRQSGADSNQPNTDRHPVHPVRAGGDIPSYCKPVSMVGRAIERRLAGSAGAVGESPPEMAILASWPPTLRLTMNVVPDCRVVQGPSR